MLNQKRVIIENILPQLNKRHYSVYQEALEKDYFYKRAYGS
jgi:hypothetical protein